MRWKEKNDIPLLPEQEIFGMWYMNSILTNGATADMTERALLAAVTLDAYRLRALPNQ